MKCPSAPRSAARTISTICIPAMAAMSASALDANIADRIRNSDLVIALGARLGEATTAATRCSIFRSRGSRWFTSIPIPRRSAASIRRRSASSRAARPLRRRSSGWSRSISRAPTNVKAAHADYLAFAEPTRSPGDVQLSQIVRGLSDRLPHDTIICNGAGNYAVWVHRFWRYRQFRTELAPTSGSMGYGLPAAVAAKLQHPERTVIAFAGDGCFQMTGHGVHDGGRKPAAADRDRLQQRHVRHHPHASGADTIPAGSPAPISPTPTSRRLRAPAAVLAPMSSAPRILPRAFDEAVASGLPSIIELTISPEALTPVASLSETRAKALAAQG